MANFSIQIAKPRLPTADTLLPYLAEIDRNRTYTNHGPLDARFEAELAAHFGLAADCITTVANATAGLTLALMAVGAKPGKYCLLPSWTFAASGHAVLAAGLEPYFVDVDATTWAIDPPTVLSILGRLGDRVGAVLAVSPFGAPLATAAWDTLSKEAGIPVVIDAAGGFDSAMPGTCPIVISLHATKPLASGEGGFVMSTNTELISEISQRANFGFINRREAEFGGMNAKMSEYHAAVGLASLREWEQSRAAFADVIAHYQTHARNGVRLQPGFGRAWVGSSCVAALPEGRSSQAAAVSLADKGIASRAWYGDGLHTHKAFRDFRVDGDLDVTRKLAASTLGLPLYHGLDEASVIAILKVLT